MLAFGGAAPAPPTPPAPSRQQHAAASKRHWARCLTNSLLDEAVLAGAAPDDGIIRVGQHETDGHHPEVLLHSMQSTAINEGPPCHGRPAEQAAGRTLVAAHLARLQAPRWPCRNAPPATSGTTLGRWCDACRCTSTSDPMHGGALAVRMLAADRTCTYTGLQPAPLWWISSPSSPSILGTEGPQMSMSSRPTCSGRGVQQLAHWEPNMPAGRTSRPARAAARQS